MNATVNLEELSVADLFALTRENSAKLAAGLDAEDFKAIKEEAKSLSEPLEWGELRTEIAGVMTDALDTKVLGGWVSAWQKIKEVKETAEKSRKAPKEPFSCNLLEHSIESTLHPYVNVLLGSKVIQKVDFEVTLSTEIDALLLNFMDGRLVSIQPGRCEWSGSITMQGAQLLEKKLAQLDLPGRVLLKNPIRLAEQN